MISPIEETPVPEKLPPDWRSAVDDEGNVYYYHSVTRQSQWDPPTSDSEKDDVCFPSPSPPSRSETKSQRPKNSTMSAAADTSLMSNSNLPIEISRKIKDRFKLAVSSVVVECLNPYRTLDCECGRITTVKDFKKIARKLTHTVMAKELKRCSNVENLKLTDSVKRKVKGYVKKYMSKHGSVEES